MNMNDLTQEDIGYQFLIKLRGRKFGALLLDQNYLTVTLIEVNDSHVKFESLDQLEEESIFFDDTHNYELSFS